MELYELIKSFFYYHRKYRLLIKLISCDRYYMVLFLNKLYQKYKITIVLLRESEANEVLIDGNITDGLGEDQTVL